MFGFFDPVTFKIMLTFFLYVCFWGPLSHCRRDLSIANLAQRLADLFTVVCFPLPLAFLVHSPTDILCFKIGLLRLLSSIAFRPPKSPSGRPTFLSPSFPTLLIRSGAPRRQKTFRSSFLPAARPTGLSVLSYI